MIIPFFLNFRLNLKIAQSLPAFFAVYTLRMFKN